MQKECTLPAPSCPAGPHPSGASRPPPPTTPDPPEVAVSLQGSVHSSAVQVVVPQAAARQHHRHLGHVLVQHRGHQQRGACGVRGGGWVGVGLVGLVCGKDACVSSAPAPGICRGRVGGWGACMCSDVCGLNAPRCEHRRLKAVSSSASAPLHRPPRRPAAPPPGLAPPPPALT